LGNDGDNETGYIEYSQYRIYLCIMML